MTTERTPAEVRCNVELGHAPEREAWEHLKQYGYAPGYYMNRCHRCGVVVMVDKRAITCRPCAEAKHAGRPLTPAEIVRMNEASRAKLGTCGA